MEPIVAVGIGKKIDSVKSSEYLAVPISRENSVCSVVEIARAVDCVNAEEYNDRMSDNVGYESKIYLSRRHADAIKDASSSFARL